MAVRTKRLFGPVALVAAATDIVVFECPPDTTARIEVVLMVNHTAGTASCMLGKTTTNAGDRLTPPMSSPGNNWAVNPYLIVLHGGEQLVARQSVANSFTVSGHGSLLDGVNDL